MSEILEENKKLSYTMLNELYKSGCSHTMIIQIESTNCRKFMGFRHLVGYNNLMHKTLRPGNIKFLERNIRDSITHHEVISKDTYC